MAVSRSEMYLGQELSLKPYAAIDDATYKMMWASRRKPLEILLDAEGGTEHILGVRAYARQLGVFGDLRGRTWMA